jgi:LysR family transcriptional regulator, regulator of gene expression of beta-lactamase
LIFISYILSPISNAASVFSIILAHANYDNSAQSLNYLGSNMHLTEISLNALRAFDAAARHANFTKAAKELCVTQAAVSHQVKMLEDYLGKVLFRRTARGLLLTEEGLSLAPTIDEALTRIGRSLSAIKDGAPKEILNVGVVGTFAVGFLMERLADFRAQHPMIDLRMMTNNNKPELPGESLDCAIRYGDGAWRSVEADRLMDAPLSPLCAPDLGKRLNKPEALANWSLLRSYRLQDWPAWFAAAGVTAVHARGPMFDASGIMVQAAMLGQGIALAPPVMFKRELDTEQLVQPFAVEVDVGAYWLTRPMGKQASTGLIAFREWLLGVTSI